MGRVMIPTDELRQAGEKLQQSIVLTRMRAANFKPGRIKARAERVVNSADDLFRNTSDMVQAATRMTGFMEKALGISVADIFALVPNERAARGVTYTGMSLVIGSVNKAIDELAAINRDMDGEVKNG